ncbi:hypothetical protein D6B98_12770 [Bradyrhizobium sp. LVM 105]|nr:hypothetical protein D6B98_12770 [Bradyrhizobium sp. LVM 105]
MAMARRVSCSSRSSPSSGIRCAICSATNGRSR